MDKNEAYQILSSFIRSTYGFYNEDKTKISQLLTVQEVEEALKNIQFQLKIVHDKTFYLATLHDERVVIFYSSPNDFEGKRVIAVFEKVQQYHSNPLEDKYPCTMGPNETFEERIQREEKERIRPFSPMAKMPRTEYEISRF